MRFHNLLFLILAPLPHLARAQAPADESRPPYRLRAHEFRQLERRLPECFASGRLDEFTQLCRDMADLLPSRPEPYLHLARAHCARGAKSEALAALARAVDLGFANPTLLRQDRAFSPLRADPAFDSLLQKAQENEKRALFRGAVPIEGIKTIEGLPAGGLRYRLRLGETATPARPHRLIVWLHPSGGLMNDVVEDLAPELAERGFALLVPTEKPTIGWTQAEGDKLLNRTLPDLAKVDALDARRPILLGFSAGGQFALLLWQKNPARFGGLILDAAYPIDRARARRGAAPLMVPPRQPAARQVPILAFVGEEDQGGLPLNIWAAAANEWTRLGIPVTLRPVPNKGHDWLLADDQLPFLFDWLSATLPPVPQTQPASH